MSRRKTAAQPKTKVEDHWFEIPGHCLSHDGVIRLREPAGTDVSQILQTLRDGSYSKPFVLDDGVTRTLHFDLRSVQSEMNLDDPTGLSFAYTRKMMAFLLFQPNPRHVVLVGLGGGSMTKFCCERLPRARVTTVEIDGDVLALADLFELPPSDQRVQLIHADAADYFATTDDYADVVLIDGCDRWGTAATFCEPSFYEDLSARMRQHGLLVINLIGLDNRINAVIRTVSETFSSRCMTLKIPGGGNRLLFAFKDPHGVVDWAQIRQRAEQLEAVHGLDFPAFARQLQRSCRGRSSRI